MTRRIAVDLASVARLEPPSAREDARQRRALRRQKRSRGGAQELGSVSHFTAWIDNHELLYRRCLGWTHGNAAEAEDLLGQLLLRMLRVEPAEFERVKCPRAWMTRVLRHLYVDLVRGNARAHTRDSAIETVLHADPVDDPVAEILRGEQSKALHEAIGALPPSLRGPLLQRHVEGLGYDEIACFHNITPATARKRCQLARDRIRQSLEATLSQP